IKPISNEGKFKIYVRELDYVDKNPVNPYNYELNYIRNIIKKVKTGNYRSIRQLEGALNSDHATMLKYMTALCSIGMIGFENGKYKFLKEVELALVGSKIDNRIISQLREKDSDKKEGETMVKEKVLYDAQGREYSAKLLDPQIVKKEDLITKVMERTFKLHDHIQVQKQKIVDDVEAYLAKVADQYGESWKGNAELVSFDSKFKIEIRYRERIQFDEKLQVAKQKIDDCLKRWSENSNLNLQAVIKEAFQVDKKGEIAKSRILGLRKYNIKDPEWIMAMDLIDQAIQITSTKQYIAFYYRPEPDKPYQQVLLNFSAM
ncbi:MAG TPA: DUF3164 family protein, partial [Candidatus Cloacimonadota bacterium]|nr:DUF3164 family protein [Candidatus Cloacimonadota bacterium]